MAYVWNVSEPGNTQIYVLKQDDAVRIATEMKYTDTESWIKKGAYVVTRPSPKLVDMLRPYEVGENTWENLIQEMSGRNAR